MRWWRRIFGEQIVPPPVLLRVSEPSGGRPSDVDVECTWYPSGRTAARRHRTAAGLCVIPWLGDEDRVCLRVASHAGASTLELERDREDGGRVREIQLGAASYSGW